MAGSDKPTPSQLRAQIVAYTRERPHYETYARTLRRVLEEAREVSFPDAFVQARAKGVSSFAEKVVRKFRKYPNAARQMTDLCGARIIVQATDQVKAVRKFIDANFVVLESDDKGLLLSEDRFGYRDMHYIVQLPSGRDKVLAISPEERKAIGKRKAEIQVRTWVQHAWADALHDRIYKNKLKISPEIRRAGNLLAALMEEGDRSFNYLADELDGQIANYAAYATRDEVEDEIEAQRLLLDCEKAPSKTLAMSLSLARLHAVSGDHAQVIRLLEPYSRFQGATRCELLLELGLGLCRLNRGEPGSSGYQRGLRHLQSAADSCACERITYIPNLRKQECMHARALARLGWAMQEIPALEHRARECWRQAHEHEPANPYYLASMLGMEVHCTHEAGLPATMRTTIRQAVKTCLQHALAGTEMPYACFTAGRLSLLLGQGDEALSYYSRGIWHFREGKHCVPKDLLTDEIGWLQWVQSGNQLPAACRNVIDLLRLAMATPSAPKRAGAKGAMATPVLIVTGGADGMGARTMERVRVLLEAGLADFGGTAIAGGTTAGVPGCVGDVAAKLARGNRRRFRLLSYLPENLPAGDAPHPAYDVIIKAGEHYGAEQLLRNWQDIVAAGVLPSRVLLLGFGGGPISATEYRVALAMGASVGIVRGTGGAADALAADPLWFTLPNLYPLPLDAATVQGFVIPSNHSYDASTLDEMAKGFHDRYVADSSGRLPTNMRPWPKLADTYRKANYSQARYSVQILERAGFAVRKTTRKPRIFKGFTRKEIELMAELEHGRWNVERLYDGWRYGQERNDKSKVHDCLVAWSDLPESMRLYDRDAVKAFPRILAKAGLEVYRL